MARLEVLKPEQIADPELARMAEASRGLGLEGVELEMKKRRCLAFAWMIMCYFGVKPAATWSTGARSAS